VNSSAKDYYVILGLDQAATLRQIKTAYRKLAKQNHPDTCPGDPQAATRFREITEAYENLSDPERRAAYDRTYTRPPGAKLTSPVPSPGVSIILKILEDIWDVIRARHGEIPTVVIVIASGTDTKHPRWGHHAPDRWNTRDGAHAEVMISGEGLRRDPRDVLATLLHEAAHALADARGIQDTSRQGRYHNKKFAALASELGLDVAENDQHGWSTTTVPAVTASRYKDELTVLADAMTVWRNAENIATARRRNTNLIAAVCGCGRIIRVAASTLDEALITCQACGQDFQPKDV
jgi:hypothetical protein